ncbi:MULTISPECIES: helix-turn-helix domain-containing protein [Rhodomicrobium]|uniref:helix-turn-helix domain-containing protein n=1 Tax=Rhodomicrobium TaxID=1068 RepID=UPI000B4BAE06|nr:MULTISPECIES: helix-turn-helix domain-containing protein [Rhodomicrobium]
MDAGYRLPTTRPAGEDCRQSLPSPLYKFDSTAITKKGRRGQQISSPSAHTGHIFFVTSGLARKFAIQPDGHRHIVNLLLPGDIVCLDGGIEETYFLEAAIDDTVIVGYTRRRIEELIAADPQFGREIQKMVLHSLARLERQLLILGRITAIEKVAGFLLEFAARLSQEKPNTLTLPISRYDIADFIGISSETVCRCMTELTRRGAIALPQPRQVTIIDRDILEDTEH